VRGSTYLFENLEQWRATRARRDGERVLSYGARGNETVFALEDAITDLEGGFRTKLFPTGLAAIAVALLGHLRSGDHLLVSEGVYDPMRRLCGTTLARFGVTTSFFPLDDPDWQRHLRPETRMVYVESPSSHLYDMADLPALTATCRARGILTCADNTWGSSLSYRPLALGCDISVIAATKYLGGHSDVMMGSVTARESAFAPIEDASVNLGQTVSADDAFLVLRGLRTLELRLQRHSASALEIAAWLGRQAGVRGVFHPALETDPNHALWKRDAQGSNGLVTIEFDPALPTERIEQGIDRLQHFGIGASWGGFESLVLPVDAGRTRLANRQPAPGYLLRLHIGLENTAELKDDLDRLLRSLA
jgi:cystathionine beta-lyase